MATLKLSDKSLEVQIEGLEEMVRHYRKAGPEVNQLLKAANKRFAEEVAVKAKGRAYPAVPGKKSSAGRPSGKGSLGRSVASIRANATPRGGEIVAGGPKALGFFGHEFGGFGSPTTRQFAMHRGKEGYFMYPTIRGEIPDAVRRWNEIIDEVFAEAE